MTETSTCGFCGEELHVKEDDRGMPIVYCICCGRSSPIGTDDDDEAYGDVSVDLGEFGDGC